MNIKRIKDAFQMTSKSKIAHDFPKNQKTAKPSLVKKFSTGNINLQLGRYSTERNIDERRENICKYKFID